MNRKKALSVAVLLGMLTLLGCGSKDAKETVRIAMPYSDNVLEPSDAYYTGWLEEKTGINIETVTIRQRKSNEYLDSLFASDSDIDIVMFGEDFTITEDELKKYADQNMLIYRDDGKPYYPNYGRKPVGDCGQILWINSDWMSSLGLKMPRTTEELYDVLCAFKDRDPNGNGIKDEIPLLSCDADYPYMASQLLLESFFYNDPYDSNNPATLKDGTDGDEAEAYKDGMEFCEVLKKEGLLNTDAATDSLQAYTELINSPADLIGAFTTDSLSNVIYQGNPEIMAKFMHVAPLAGPEGERNAMYVERTFEVGAIICANSEHIEAAKKLLDLMMTKEASLIARYGEEGVDWEYSDGTDVSIYGTPSTIVTKNYIWNTPQNKHLNGIGPMDVPTEYLKGVTWNGVNSDAEYIDARAQMSYAAFLPEVK